MVCTTISSVSFLEIGRRSYIAGGKKWDGEIVFSSIHNRDKNSWVNAKWVYDPVEIKEKRDRLIVS